MTAGAAPEILLSMHLRQIPGSFSIGRYDPDTAFSPLLSRNFCSITRTPDEVTIVCESDLLPMHFTVRDDHWACLEVDGNMNMSLREILARLSPSLPNIEIALFIISTHDSDFVFVKQQTLERATAPLRKMGIHVE